MALATGTLIGLGIAGSLVGAGVQYHGTVQTAEASKRAEAIRLQQLNLESERQRRQALREAGVARGLALSNATNQGAQQSSGLEGGIAQVTGQANSNIRTVNQSQDLGQQMFQAHEQMAQGQETSAFGSAISGVSNTFLQNMPSITRVGRYYSGFGS